MTASWWDTKIIARCRCSARSANRLRICAWTDTSSALTASSAMSRSGWSARARAMATRCRCPPDSCARTPVGVGPGQSDRLQQLADQRPLRPPRAATSPWTRAGSAMASPDRDERVERGVRVLVDELHPATDEHAAALRWPRTRPGHRTWPCRSRAPRAERGSARAWSCRCPTPRPGPAISRRPTSRLTSSTARHGRAPAAAGPVAETLVGSGKVLTRSRTTSRSVMRSDHRAGGRVAVGGLVERDVGASSRTAGPARIAARTDSPPASVARSGSWPPMEASRCPVDVRVGGWAPSPGASGCRDGGAAGAPPRPCPRSSSLAGVHHRRPRRTCGR